MKELNGTTVLIGCLIIGPAGGMEPVLSPQIHPPIVSAGLLDEKTYQLTPRLRLVYRTETEVEVNAMRIRTTYFNTPSNFYIEETEFRREHMQAEFISHFERRITITNLVVGGRQGQTNTVATTNYRYGSPSGQVGTKMMDIPPLGQRDVKEFKGFTYRLRNDTTNTVAYPFVLRYPGVLAHHTNVVVGPETTSYYSPPVHARPGLRPSWTVFVPSGQPFIYSPWE